MNTRVGEPSRLPIKPEGAGIARRDDRSSCDAAAVAEARFARLFVPVEEVSAMATSNVQAGGLSGD
jgi:hypothetical protein